MNLSEVRKSLVALNNWNRRWFYTRTSDVIHIAAFLLLLSVDYWLWGWSGAAGILVLVVLWAMIRFGKRDGTN